MIKEQENKREHFRIKLLTPLDGILHIDANRFPINISNLSTKGIEFTSTMDLPLSKTNSCIFSFNFEESSFLLNGRIIRKTFHVDNDNIEYGVELLVSEKVRKHLFVLINKREIRRKKLIKEK